MFYAGSCTSTAKHSRKKMRTRKGRHSEDADVGEKLTGRQVNVLLTITWSVACFHNNEQFSCSSVTLHRGHSLVLI